MVVCPKCNEQVPHSSDHCPRCGEKVIPADDLEEISTNTTDWQKIVIAATIILLILIGFTFYGAEDREDRAAQDIFNQSLMHIVSGVAAQTAIGHYYGVPAYQLKAGPKKATATVIFSSPPLAPEQAATYGSSVCASLAKAYVRKGYMPRSIKVNVASQYGNDYTYYGEAVYNGNLDKLAWEAAQK